MLWFSSKNRQPENDEKTYSKDQICSAVQEAWRLSYEIEKMGAEQTSAGWGVSERACNIADEMLSHEIDEIGAEQTSMGMGFSEYACKLDAQLEIIAEKHGCKLKARAYG